MGGDSVERRAHAVLAHAPVKQPAARHRPKHHPVLCGDAGALGEVGRAARQLGNALEEHVHHLLRGLPGGELPVPWHERRQSLVPAVRQRAGHHPLKPGRGIRVRLTVLGEEVVPLSLELFTLGSRLAPVFQRVVRHGERLLRPAEDLLGLLHFLRAEGRAVGGGGVHLGGRGVADVGPEHDERRAGFLAPGGIERQVDGVEVIAVIHVLHVPAICLEALAHVLAEGERGIAVDGDVVVVVDEAELAQPEVSRKAGRFAGDAFHEVTIAAEAPDPVVDDFHAGTVVLLREDPLGDGHPHRVAEALAQGASGGLDPGSVPPLRMTRRLRAPLPELPDVLQRKVVASEVEQGVEQHRRVTAGKHEAVAVGPVGIGRVVAQEVAPEDVCRRRQRHGGAGVAGLGGLHRIHGQSANGIDGFPRELARWVGGGGNGLSGGLGRRIQDRLLGGDTKER